MRYLILAVLAATLAACATATPYQPAAAGGYGFTEQRVEDNRYSITFSGNSLTGREQVETALLFRAAELTVAQGFDHFIVANRATDGQRRYTSFGSPSRYGFYPDFWAYGPRHGWRSWYDPFWDDREFREVTRFKATAEIVMYKGPKPTDNPQAFDARQVVQNLGPQVVRPAPAL